MTGALPSRVVVTGLGTISPPGKTVGEFWQNLCAGKPCIGPIGERWTENYPNFPEEVRTWIGAQVDGYDPLHYFGKRELQFLDRYSQFAVIAAQQAVDDAGLVITQHNRDNAAVILGTSTGGDESRDEASYRFFHEKRRVPNLTIMRTMASAACSHVSICHGITGPTYSVQSACASATHAMGQAFWLIKQGAVDIALTGGTDTLPSLGLFKAWEAMRILAPDTCRPFCSTRKGLVLGEGAGIFVLESLEHAHARGAKIYAEITGFGMSSDAADIIAPTERGPVSAMKMALKSAGYAPDAIDYINAHGTGTPANDTMESAAIRTVFGAHADTLAVSSTKSMHGHALGAAGALEGMAAILAVQNDIVPPTINVTEQDPACDLNIVANVARPMTVNKALNNSFGFGGLNGVLAIEKFS